TPSSVGRASPTGPRSAPPTRTQATARRASGTTASTARRGPEPRRCRSSPLSNRRASPRSSARAERLDDLEPAGLGHHDALGLGVAVAWADHEPPRHLANEIDLLGRERDDLSARVIGTLARKGHLAVVRLLKRRARPS